MIVQLHAACVSKTWYEHHANIDYSTSVVLDLYR